uniref:HEAT repeat-containing protein 6 n=1 Tax=Scleropages formosus TaxID=113540 RepID=A0A8C9WGS6_SCLFO
MSYLPDLLGRGGVLVRYSSPSQPDLELRRTAVHCLANLCLGLPGQPYLEESYRSVCFQTFLQILQAPRPPNVDDIVFCMLLQDALKGMQYYLNGAKGKLTAGEHLGTLLAVLKKYMFFGLWGINLEMPTILYPTPLPQYEGVPAAKEDSPRDVPNKKRKSRGRSKKAEPEAGHGEDDEEAQEAEVRQSPRKAGGGETHSHWSLGPTYAGRPSSVAQREAPPSLYPSWKRSSSDSEFSDPEGGMQSKLRLYQARVRQGALHCFLAAVKCVEKRVLYGYWSSFVPDAPSIGSPPALTLLTIALKDPSPKVRAGSLQVLSALLEGSRKFLSAAEDTGAPRQAFTPFSVTLAGSLRELHRGLVLALVAESSSQTLTQVIKCLAHLVCNVPYGRLRPGLLKTLWQQIGPYVSHRDVNVRVSSLTLLGAVVSAQAPLSEVRLLLQQPPGSGSASGALSGPSTPQEAQPQGGRSGPEKEAPSSCGRLPEGNSQSQCWLLQLCVSLVVQPREDPCSDSDAGAAAPGALEPSPVSNITFSNLFFITQLLCITVLLGLSYSENSPVKAAAVRALGVYVLFPCLREDVMFVADTANSILTSLEDRSPNVRAKAAWSLGNLTDTLIVNMASVGRDFQEEFSDMLLLKMLRSATSACLGDKDRVKSNAVRALGNLLHFLQPAHLSRSGFEGPMDEAVRALIDAVRSDATMKVRWNACYALGNAFRNPALPLGTAPWTADAYSALSQAVTCCRNFKVRIKSAAALSVPAERDRYGGAAQFGKLWRALARALECSNEAEDFLEYRYCAGLRTQLCRTLLHLMSLCQPDDLPAVAAPLAEESRPALHAYFAHYHLDEGNQGQPENDGVRESCQPQEKLGRLEEIVAHLRSFPEMSPHTREAQTQVVSFLEEVLRSCHESQAPSPLY